MRLSTLCIATVLAVGSIGLANAVPVNLVQNGDFSQTSPTKSVPTQFGAKSGTNASGHWGGQFVTGWTGASGSIAGGNGYTIWEPSAYAAVNTFPTSQYGTPTPPPAYTLGTGLYAPPVAASPGGTFVAIDGEGSYQGIVQQTISGLTKGQTYAVSFYWGATETQKATKTTTAQLQVSLGSQTHLTQVFSNPPQGFSGWQYVTFKFGANAASELLSFMAIGTPAGLPPMAVLTGVSMHKVPEPASWAMFGSGLLGLGLLTLLARRSAARRYRTADGGDIA